MGYKILGFLVWQGGKLYLRRRVNGVALTAALAGLAAVAVAGAVAAQKQSQSTD